MWIDYGLVMCVLVCMQLIKFLNEERARYMVYPPASDVFSWTLSCAIDEVSGECTNKQKQWKDLYS